MDTERPHRSTSSSNSSSTSELFVCFTSRLSSSSMKLSSKSLLSPSRSSRDPPQISLSSSLSRRLRSNGSMKGGQASPMFPTVGKRRGCGFENPEPSSPKVTCIGQVRVKTKKQGKKMRARSKRRSEASFRKTTTDGGVNSSDLTRQNSSSAFQYQNNHQNLQQECLKHRNQRWVHLPLTICEALREFNCFFPCRSSCMREKGEKGGAFGEEGSNGGGHGHHHHGREGSCGAAFARWLHVALQEGGDGKGREIEVVMREDEVEVENDDGDGDGDGDDGRQRINAGRSYRRHVFEDIDIDEVEGKKENEGEGGEAEKARVSICVPPKNALLLMRCRSDPVKMAALANRFWESPVHKDQHGVNVEDDEENEEDEGHGVEEHQEEEAEEEQKEVEMEEDEGVRKNTEEARNSICEREREGSVESEEQHHHVVPFTEEAEQAEEEPEVMESFEIESRTNPDSSEVHEANLAKEEQEKDEDEDEEGNASHQQDESFSCASILETHSDLEKPETTLEARLQEENNNQEEVDKNDESSELSSTPETLNASEPQNDEAEAPQPQPEQQPKTATIAETETSTEEEEEEEESSTEEQQQHKQQNVTTDTPPPPPPPPEVTPPTQEEPDPNNEPGSEERENGSNGDQRERERERETLPECLLLMMCEPKLSMEVSKETWVCSTDFIRWLPERQAGKAGGGGRRVSAVEGKNGVEKKASPAAAAPPRSSCSFPAAAGVSMAAMIEQRLAAGTKSNGYEPFVLTRCKSEPMRSTAKLAADACFWKKPHAPPATLGVGAAAGVGF